MEIILPPDMDRNNTCCFTGHRKIPDDRWDFILRTLVKIVTILASSGYRYFICGGALGFDTLAANAVTAAAEKNSDIRLILALPCLNQTEKWLGADDGEEHIREYRRLKGLAHSVVYTGEMYSDDCMKKRNQFMVDNSSFCISYYNGAVRSGTGQTHRMAVKAGLTVFNLYDNSSSEGTPDD